MGKGVKTAVDTVMAETKADPVSEAAALELELDLAAAGPAQGSMWLLPDEAQAKGPGRPKGSRNRTTTDMIRLMRARGVPDPLEFLSQFWSLPTAAVAKAMGIKAGDAAALQIRAAIDSLPYWHSKQPVVLDAGAGGALPVIQIITGTGQVQVNAGGGKGLVIGEVAADAADENYGENQ